MLEPTTSTQTGTVTYATNSTNGTNTTNAATSSQANNSNPVLGQTQDLQAPPPHQPTTEPSLQLPGPLPLPAQQSNLAPATLQRLGMD